MKSASTHELIHDLAIRATAGTLKRIYDASGNEKIQELRNNLQKDLNHVSSSDYRQAENIFSDHVLSEAYDLYMTAYEYLFRKIIKEGKADQDTEARTQKNGTEKTRTIFQWACVEVRQAIYAEKAIENSGKYTYIEDMKLDGETAENALERHYIRMGKYYDMGGTIHNDGLTGMAGVYTADNSTYEGYQGILEEIDLSDRQKLIIHYRMQGVSVSAIGEKLGVSQQAISKSLQQVQKKIGDIFPDMIRAFNLDKRR